MLEIKVKVEVDLSERTAALLQRKPLEDLPCDGCNFRPPQDDLKAFVKETVYEFLRDLQDHARKPAEKSVEEAKPETAQSPVPEEKPAPAAPAAPAPAEQKAMQEVTDAILRQAVKEAKDRAGGTAVRSLFSEFEIPNSSACPQERRSELLGRLANL